MNKKFTKITVRILNRRLIHLLKHPRIMYKAINGKSKIRIKIERMSKPCNSLHPHKKCITSSSDILNHYNSVNINSWSNRI